MIHARKHPTLDVAGCQGCKFASIRFATVPGARKDEERGTSRIRQREQDLHRYRDKRSAGEMPDGTTKEAMDRYDRKVAAWERNEKTIIDWNEPEKVKSTKRALLNKA